MLLPGPDLHCAGPLAVWDFCYIFLPNVGEGQKKFYHLNAGPLALFHIVNLDLIIALRSEKVTWGPEVATFRTKTLNFFQVIHLNWLAKIWIEGALAPWLSILVLLLIDVVHVYCTVVCENAKRNWHWRNNRLCCHIFIIGGISSRETRAPWDPSVYAYALSVSLNLNELQQSSRRVVYSSSTEIRSAGGAWHKLH